MFRKTLTILSLIGLLLSGGAWCMSYWGISYATPRFQGIQLCAGTFNCYDQRFLSATGYIFHPPWRFSRKREPATLATFSSMTPWRLWGIEYYWHLGASYPTMQIPLWMPTFLFASPCFALLYLPARRRRKRKKLGLCVKCGYDLRGSKDRCPECNLTFDPALVEELRRRAEQSQARMAHRLVRVDKSIVRKACVAVALLILLCAVGVWVAQSVKPLHLYSSFDINAIPGHPLLTEKVYDLKKARAQVVHTTAACDILDGRGGSGVCAIETTGPDAVGGDHGRGNPAEIHVPGPPNELLSDVGGGCRDCRHFRVSGGDRSVCPPQAAADAAVRRVRP